MLFLLSCHRYYTAGSGIPQAVVHRGLHLSVTIFVLFMSFPAWGRGRRARPLTSWAIATRQLIAKRHTAA